MERWSARRRPPIALTVALLVVLIVALVAGAWAFERGRMGSASQAIATSSTVRTIELTKAGLACPNEPNWSPNGAYIAVFASQGDCTAQASAPVIAVFDARTDALKHSFTLPHLLAAQGVLAGLRPTLFAWSPDSASLVFSVGYDPDLVLPPHTKRGLMFISVANGSTQFFADSATATQPAGSATQIWDVKSGKLAHVITGLPPAPAYTWNADGSITPSANATGKNSMGLWQPGYITPSVSISDPTAPPLAVYYFAILPSWSPDGRYLALPLMLGARMPGGAITKKGEDCPYNDAVVCQGATTIAAPDAGYNAALAAAEAGWKQPGQGQVTLWNAEAVAWRADGQELATMLPGDDFSNSQPTARITIFNTHTGAKVRTLTIQRVNVSESGGGYTPELAWSPRGSSLALVDFGDTTLTIWRSA